MSAHADGREEAVADDQPAVHSLWEAVAGDDAGAPAAWGDVPSVRREQPPDAQVTAELVGGPLDGRTVGLRPRSGQLVRVTARGAVLALTEDRGWLYRRAPLIRPGDPILLYCHDAFVRCDGCGSYHARHDHDGRSADCCSLCGSGLGSAAC